jgi:hypothetical protein
MRYLVAVLPIVCAGATSAAAVDLPPRKSGLWELTMTFAAGRLPPHVMKQCVDPESDRLMNQNFGAANGQACSRQDVAKSGGTIVIDSVCKFGETTTVSHAVVSGSFDSAYTVDVTSKREGGPPLPGAKPGAETHTRIAAKWLGPCEPGQRPGDVTMANGMTMNVLDLQKMRPAPK